MRMASPRLMFLASLLAGSLLLVAEQGARAASPVVWELTPYRVRLVLTVAPAPELSAALEAELRTGLAEQVERFIGAAWNATVDTAPPALRDRILTDLAAFPAEAIPTDWLDDDKLIFLRLRFTAEGYEIAGREFDVRTRVWGSPVARTVGHPAQLNAALFAVARRAFAPLAQLEAIEGDRENVLLRLRASGLPARDPDCLPAASGDLFRPMLRTNDRDGKLRQVTAVPWTYLSVTEVTPTVLRAKVVSGVHSPLAGRPRGRVERLALAIHPTGDSTRLLVRSRTDKNKPLAGYQLYRQLPDGKSVAYLGRTDRHGHFVVEPDETPLRLLLIKSGEELLARLPVVPGLDAEIVAPVADDDQRLEAEGFIAGFQEGLVDLVTRREVLQAQIHGRIEAKEYRQAQELLRSLRQMKGRDDLTQQLRREQQKVFSRDPIVQRKIDKMFDDTEKLINQYLAPANVERLAQELSDAQSGKLSGATGGPPTPASPAPPGTSAAGPG